MYKQPQFISLYGPPKTVSFIIIDLRGYSCFTEPRETVVGSWITNYISLQLIGALPPIQREVLTGIIDSRSAGGAGCFLKPLVN